MQSSSSTGNLSNLIRKTCTSPSTTRDMGALHEHKHQGDYLKLLTENRDYLYPLTDYNVFELFQECQQSLWTAEEVDLEEDTKDLLKMNSDELRYVMMVLFFFRYADIQVLENSMVNMWKIIKLPEARMFYALQSYIEAIHMQQYGLLVLKYSSVIKNNQLEVSGISNEELDAYVKGGDLNISSLESKRQWVLDMLNEANEKPDASILPKMLLAFACVEGIFFSGAFAAIDYFKKRGMLPGLCKANEFISRDEGQHLRLGCLLYKKLKNSGNGLHKEEVKRMVLAAVEVEKEFVCESLPVALIGLNSDSMSQHIEFMADYMLTLAGEDKLFFSESPYDFFDVRNLERKTNFFEERPSEYSIKALDHVFSIDEDF